jgi:hypothetical protein
MTASNRTGKTGSRNPAKKATSVSAWKKGAEVPLLELPSGNYMRIKKVGLQALLTGGIMPNSLMGFAEKALKRGGSAAEGPSEDDLADLLQDPKKVKEIGLFMDNLLCKVAAEPVVHMLPEDGVERDPELLYVDEVDEEDKMFIFQVVTGGTTDIEAFRRETGSTMAAIRGREDVELPSE